MDPVPAVGQHTDRHPARTGPATIDRIDMVKRLRQQTERIGYPILGVVTQINQMCRDKLGEYVHWGATTQDITDTATVLQIREALELVEADLIAIARAWPSWRASTG
jgi:3-carboxy-cis,cis-muconate cycloisomerase